MSDRTSAEIFGNLFVALAKINDDTAKKIAQKAWKWSQNYDFSVHQMDANDELRKLGIDPGPDDGDDR